MRVLLANVAKVQKAIGGVLFIPRFSSGCRLLSSFLPNSLRKSFSSVPLEMSNDKKLWNVVFVLGPPGSGKGTQCSRIAKEFGYVHLSAGDLLREERARDGSSLGALIENHIRNGTIVPVEITCKLIENAMSAVGHPPGFLVDGFPRNQDNFDGWNREMGTKAKVEFVLFLDCDQEVCVKRCLGRNQGRSDDNEDSLRKRIVTYVEQTKPIIDKYSASGIVRHVDASKNPDEVFAEISKLFKKQ